jgi:hypothetical protein
MATVAIIESKTRLMFFPLGSELADVSFLINFACSEGAIGLLITLAYNAETSCSREF